MGQGFLFPVFYSVHAFILNAFIHSFIFFGFGIESRALGRLDECLTMELLPQPFTLTLRQDIISLGCVQLVHFFPFAFSLCLFLPDPCLWGLVPPAGFQKGSLLPFLTSTLCVLSSDSDFLLLFVSCVESSLCPLCVCPCVQISVGISGLTVTVHSPAPSGLGDGLHAVWTCVQGESLPW